MRASSPNESPGTYLATSVRITASSTTVSTLLLMILSDLFEYSEGLLFLGLYVENLPLGRRPVLGFSIDDIELIFFLGVYLMEYSSSIIRMF